MTVSQTSPLTLDLLEPARPLQGAIADLDQLQALIRLARTHDFTVAIDECYAEIYNDAPPPGALQAAAERAAR